MKLDGLVWTIARARTTEIAGTAMAINSGMTDAITAAGGVVFADGNVANDYDAKQEEQGYPGTFVEGVIDGVALYVPRP